MAYYRTEDNVYCDSIKTSVTAGNTVDNISVKAKGPCKITGIIAKFATETSGPFTVSLTRNGVTVELLNVDLDNNQNIVATEVNVWIPNAGNPNYQDSKLTIVNDTLANADVIIDYAY